MSDTDCAILVLLPVVLVGLWLLGATYLERRYINPSPHLPKARLRDR